jgi:hypothetical protein
MKSPACKSRITRFLAVPVIGLAVGALVTVNNPAGVFGASQNASAAMSIHPTPGNTGDSSWGG